MRGRRKHLIKFKSEDGHLIELSPDIEVANSNTGEVFPAERATPYVQVLIPARLLKTRKDVLALRQ